MYSVFLNVLQMSLYGSITILVILLFRALLKNTPKKITYVLWIVVGVRLLCPFNLSTPISVMNLNTSDYSKVNNKSVYKKFINVNHEEGKNVENINEVEKIDEADVYDNVDKSTTSGLVKNDINEKQEEQIDIVDNKKSNSNIAYSKYAENQNEKEAFIKKENIKVVLAYVWILGMLMIGFSMFRKFFDVFFKLKSLDVKESNGYYESKEIDFPFTCGIIKPKVYIPQGMSEQEKEYVVLHEKTHIKNKDHFIKLIGAFAVIIHWFNPLVWIAYSLMSSDLEMRCDEKVIDVLGDDVRKDYCYSIIIHASELTNRYNFVVNSFARKSLGGMEVKSRIKNLIGYKKVHKIIAGVLVCVAIVTSIGITSKATRKNNDKEHVLEKVDEKEKIDSSKNTTNDLNTAQAINYSQEIDEKIEDEYDDEEDEEENNLEDNALIEKYVNTKKVKNYREQIKTIVKLQDEWYYPNPDEKENSYNRMTGKIRFAITDLDHNDRLEVIVGYKDKCNRTYVNVFEVNSDFSSLKKCTYNGSDEELDEKGIIDIMESDSSGIGKIYTYKDGENYVYLGTNINRVFEGMNYGNYSYNKLKLSDGNIEDTEEIYTDYSSDDELCYDKNGNEISFKKFDKIARKFFEYEGGFDTYISWKTYNQYRLLEDCLDSYDIFINRGKEDLEVRKQIMKFVGKEDEWSEGLYHDTDDDESYSYYTVTDLNHDGNIEVIVDKSSGHDHVSDWYMYTIEDGKIIQCNNIGEELYGKKYKMAKTAFLWNSDNYIVLSEGDRAEDLYNSYRAFKNGF